MKSVRLVDEAPFMRIAIPFAIGIAAQEVLPHILLLPALVIGAFFLLFHFYTLRRIELRFRYRNLFACAIAFLLFACGGLSLYIEERNAPTPELFHHTIRAIARIDATTSSTEKSSGYQATLLHLVGEDKSRKDMAVPLLLRIENDTAHTALQRGDLIAFRPHIVPIANRRNPEAFDYAALMRHKGFIYTQYIPVGEWKSVGHSTPGSFMVKALNLRDTLIRLIATGDFSAETTAILNALLVGYADELTPEQRASFSTAGLSHVLAVSGLHTGIVWLILSALLAPLLWWHKRRVHALCILVALWAYAFITGLSPSVIRACVMASVVLVGIVIGRKSRPINGLFVAVTGMLLYNPHYLFQVGFQLSVLSVFAILYLYPPLYSAWSPRSRVVDKLWSCMAVSLTAQLGTLPLVIYYFHELPLLGLLTNLIVVPLLPVLLTAGFIWVGLAACGIDIPLFTSGIECMTYGLNELTRLVSTLDFASIRNIYIEPHNVLLWFIIIFGMAEYLLSRRTGILIGVMVCTLIFLLSDTIVAHRPIRNQWVVYQESNTATLNFIDNGCNMLLPLDTVAERKTEREAAGWWLKNGIDNVSYVGDATTRGNLRIRLPYIQFQGDRIIVLDRDYRRATATPERMSIDYAIVCPGFKGKIDVVRQIFDIRQVILTHNLPYFQQKAIVEECARLRIDCHRISRDGAWVRVSEIE
ncbi:MAG: ComEC/Rec2 family competence protein [Coprobacter sp.]|nr:ComEC/Rec2 family competence protein [Coprobacter sp.]